MCNGSGMPGKSTVFNGNRGTSSVTGRLHGRCRPFDGAENAILFLHDPGELRTRPVGQCPLAGQKGVAAIAISQSRQPSDSTEPSFTDEEALEHIDALYRTALRLT